MRRILSNRSVVHATFDTVPFEGAWLASFGRPELRGCWLIFGGSGCGKSTFAMMLAKYLSQWRRVMYNSLEQGLSRSVQMTWVRCNMAEAGSRIVFCDGEQLEEMMARLAKPKSPSVIVIDSITAMSGLNKKTFNRLIHRFPFKLFIFIAHEKNHMPDPAIAEHVRRLSEVKIHVTGFKAHVTTRYADAEENTGETDFVIWEEGAARFEVENV